MTNKGRLKRCKQTGQMCETAQITRDGVTRHCMKKNGKWYDRDGREVKYEG